MTKEQLEQYAKGLEFQKRMRSVWNDLYDKGLKSGVYKVVTDNRQLWYFREAVRRDDFNWFLSRADLPVREVEQGVMDKMWDALSELGGYDIYVDSGSGEGRDFSATVTAQNPRKTNYGFDIYDTDWL